MVTIMISFAGNADIEKVKPQMVELASRNDCEFICCFLNRAMVTEKGFDTKIVDAIDEAFGKKMTYVADGSKDFTSFMLELPELRKKTIDEATIVYALGTEMAKGLAEELNYANMGKSVIYISSDEPIK
jgi:hypothetical protein